jgi:1-acyl-sn-glycerol-3-phosphate acyltransferase
VADAEVIPIGTGGRPGRGSGSDRPSQASRRLAGPTRPAGSGPRLAATTTDRAAGAGIPPADWLAAFRTGATEVFGNQWEPQLARFLGFLRRRLTGHYAVDEDGFDREVTDKVLLASLRPLAEKWFRIEARGVANLPAVGGALVVSNHSGTLPVDSLMTMFVVHEHTGRFLRPLGADLVFRLPLVSTLARTGGATLASTEDAERLLSGGELVGVWPEGFKGIGKPFAERYQLQRFGRGGFVAAAVRAGVPIVPLSVIGAEEIYPLVGNLPTLARALGLPYVPITPLFPWLGPLGLVPLPSKWLMEFGEPIRTDEYAASAAGDPRLVSDVAGHVRGVIQRSLHSLLAQRSSIWG